MRSKYQSSRPTPCAAAGRAVGTVECARHFFGRQPAYCLAVWFLVALAAWSPATSARAQLWKQFVPTTRIEADPAQEYRLTQENGPWMVIAATFSGDGGLDQAHELILEFREKYNLPAFLHEMTFDYSKESPGRGLDQYGAPIRRRYQHDDVREYAVLVGEFPTIDAPEAQQLLRRIKTMTPDALDPERHKKTAQTLAQIRQFQSAMMSKLGTEQKRGPMGQAFLARNPLLPREYFVPQGVDPFVAKMNKGVEHSLLDCPGHYTVQVATFRGNTILQASGQTEEPSGIKLPWKNQGQTPLVEAAENAHLLTEELCSHGWEAYEFHDRTESYVTIGSFDKVGQRLADGSVEPTPQVQKILETFGAIYDTPADPLSGIGNDQFTQRRVDEREHQYAQQYSSQLGQVAPGMHPKHVKIFKGRRVERIIPMDITPHAIEVPRRSVSSDYVRE